MNRRADLEVRLVALAERRPFRLPTLIRIAGLCKLCSVFHHCFRNLARRLIRSCANRAENICQLGGMGNASFRILRRLWKIAEVILPGLRGNGELAAQLRTCAEAEAGIGSDANLRPLNLVFGVGRVQGQNLAG
jgi:hypothetical protein